MKKQIRSEYQKYSSKIVILEKGADVGSHGISGAVLDPIALTELIPDWKEREDFPLEQWVERESMIALTSETSGIEWPFYLQNFMILESRLFLSLFQRWCLISLQKENEILTGTAGWDLLFDEQGAVRGVRTRDRGLDTDGTPKRNMNPEQKSKPK